MLAVSFSSVPNVRRPMKFVTNLEIAQVARFQQDEASILPSLLRHLAECPSSLLQVPSHDEVFLRRRHRNFRMILYRAAAEKTDGQAVCSAVPA